MPSILIIVPCYNEEKRLPVAEYRRFARDSAGKYRFLFVNDGSKDNTQSVIDGLKAEFPAIFDTYQLRQNSGKAEAVRQGIARGLKASPDFVGFWDSDLATPLAELDNFMSVFETRSNIDIVIGARVQLLGREIKRKPIRHYLGRIFATTASMYLRIGIYDTQCGAKIFRKTPITEAIFRRPFVSRWLFDVELLVRYLKRARTIGGPKRIYEVSLQTWEDVAGSKVKSGDFLKAMKDFLNIVVTYR